MANNELVKSLLKGLDILYLVSKSENGMKVGEIARELGFKAPTAHNLVRTLSARKFLEKKRNGFYTVGVSIFELFALQYDRKIMLDAANSIKRIIEKFPDATVTVAQLIDTEVIVSLRISPDRPEIIQKPENMKLQLFSNASGLCFLANIDKDEYQYLLETYPFPEHGANIWKNEQKLKKYLVDIQKKGYAVRPYSIEHSFAVACPVFDNNLRVKFSIGASIPISKKNDSNHKELIDCLLEEGHLLQSSTKIDSQNSKDAERELEETQ